ncbi:glycoside hydrolase family 32 protein [Halosimplex amylolyticum]|uniref:glycoside hydrolase family 32 protein n=1 Tax=Halosimplex amylolyticum TaxID=3396616 RepID=UPI003F555F6B
MDTDIVRDARRLRESYQEDHHRPRFHFVAPEGHCSPFDPNGALYWNGRYHLFYLIGTYEEEQTSWGHASSADLLHWRHHPRALVPNADEEHMFSGDAFITRNGTPALVYHSVGHGNCIATAADEDLIEWQKSPANPVMPNPAWDPAAWREDDVYYSLSGSNPEHEPDELTLYRSEDLEQWEKRHQFVFSPEEWDVGADYSCPDFFSLGDKHVLLFISHDRGAQCLVGRYEDERFYPEDHYRMNWPGGTLFAPESLVDEDGRRIFWAWVPEARSPEAQLESGWSGVMSLPRTLSFDEDGRLLVRPVSELKRLRSNHRSDGNIEVGPGRDHRPSDAGGRHLELSIEIVPETADEVGVAVCRSPDGEEQTAVSYIPSEEVLRVDTHNASASDEVTNPWPHPGVGVQEEMEQSGAENDVWVQEAPFALTEGERLSLQLFLDGSILEVFANDRQCVTQRLYPDREDSTGVSVFARGGDASVESIDTWDLIATNPW